MPRPRRVETSADWKEFFSPPGAAEATRSQEAARLDVVRNPFYRAGYQAAFIATGERRGRVAVFIDERFNAVARSRVAFFGMLATDGPGVAGQLLDAAVAWAKGRGMARVIGPWVPGLHGRVGAGAELGAELERAGWRAAGEFSDWEIDLRLAHLPEHALARAERAREAGRVAFRSANVRGGKGAVDAAFARDALRSGGDPMSWIDPEAERRILGPGAFDRRLFRVGEMGGEAACMALAVPDLAPVIGSGPARFAWRALGPARRLHVQRCRLTHVAARPESETFDLGFLSIVDMMQLAPSLGYPVVELSSVPAEGSRLREWALELGCSPGLARRLYERPA